MKEQLVAAFRSNYGRDPEVVTRAPGRLEILGNHTDYNEGVVLSVAVDKATFVAAAKRSDNTCRLIDIVHEASASFDITQLDSPTPGEWTNYVKGVIVELVRRGIAVPGFDAVLGSTVPMSAGMSSSAALEISVGYALGNLTNADLPWQDWARIGQAAENNYVGAKTGLLDQFSSIKGKHESLVFSDFRSLEVANVPLPAGTALVIANSMVKHNLTNEYNERRECCEDAVARLTGKIDRIQALRDVSREQLDQYRDELDPTTYRRALHVVGENERVLAGIEALNAGDLDAFGALMFESHESSRVNFENSCPELDKLVDIAKSLDGAIGARLSGGGFGGITVHLVHADCADTYMQELGQAYKAETGVDPQAMVCQAGAGAEILG